MFNIQLINTASRNYSKMKKILLSTSILLILSSCNPQSPNKQEKKETSVKVQQTNINYKTYQNKRYDYSVDYPDFLIPQGEAGNEDGQKFISENGTLQMAVYRTFKMNMTTGETLTIQESLDEDLNDLYVEEKKIQDNFYILSGITEGNNHFSKYTTVINDEYYTIFFEYDDEHKQQLTEVFEYVVKSFIKE